MILAPGTHPNIPLADYLATPMFSASLIRHIVNECPKAAWYASWLNPNREHDDTHASDAGTIAHAILLEGSTAGVVVIDPEDHPAEKTGAIPIGWTNKSIKAARDDARARGKIPVLLDDMQNIENMVYSAHDFIESLKSTEPAIWAAFQPDGGDSELSCLWDDHGTLCRMRPDRISKDRKLIVDPKFTERSAEPNGFARAAMTPMGYWISAAMYRRGCQALFDTAPDYVFLIVEQDAPHLCSLVGVDPAGFAHGGAQVERGLRTWRKCVAANSWPGYPTRVCYPELKPWEVFDEQERQGVAPDGIPYDIERLFERNAA